MTKVDIVEQIHREVDTAQDRLMAEATAMLDWYKKEIAEIKTPKLTIDQRIDKRADMLEKYGFTNTPEVVYKMEAVKQTEAQKKEAEVLRAKMLEESKVIAEKNEILLELTKAYPFEKILTKEELDRICAKYKLVYAQVDSYKKTVPDKNLNDIAKAKPLDISHSANIEYSLHFPSMAFEEEYEADVYNFFRGKHDRRKFSSKKEADEWLSGIKYDLRSRNVFSDIRLLLTDKTGLFIAAPKSHFDLNGLVKDGFGFFRKKFIPEPKDPIVFQFLKGDFIRVITKWGKEGEDEALILPVLN